MIRPLLFLQLTTLIFLKKYVLVNLGRTRYKMIEEFSFYSLKFVVV